MTEFNPPIILDFGKCRTILCEMENGTWVAFKMQGNLRQKTIDEVIVHKSMYHNDTIKRTLNREIFLTADMVQQKAFFTEKPTDKQIEVALKPQPRIVEKPDEYVDPWDA